MSITYRHIQNCLLAGVIIASSIGLTACGNSNDPPKETVKEVFTRFISKNGVIVKSVDDIQCKKTSETTYLCVAQVTTGNILARTSATTRYTVPLQQNGSHWFAIGMPMPNGQY